MNRHTSAALARYPKVSGPVLVEPNSIRGHLRPTAEAVYAQRLLWAAARPTSPVETLIVGVVTHRWIEVAPVPGTHLNAIRGLVEVTTSDATITAELHQIRPVEGNHRHA